MGDRRFQELFRYVYHSAHDQFVSFIGNGVFDLSCHLFIDADFAGDGLSSEKLEPDRIASRHQRRWCDPCNKYV